MATLRALLVFGLLTFFVPCAKAQEKPTLSGSSATGTAKPEFPLMVRIDDKALDPLREKNIQHRGRVDRIILGTRAIGTSSTTGAINVEIIPDRDDASFTIRCHGQTQTQTSGNNGPAIIRSRTFTEFECARRVVFDPRTGLVAGPTTMDARTTLVYDGFDTNRGLGRRLITRVAERRANQQYELVRVIVQRDNMAEVRQAFDKHLDQQLASINAQLDIPRYVNLLFGPTSNLHLATHSCKDCILVGIGKGESPSRLVTQLPERTKSAPIEIWVHNSLFGESMVGLAAILEKIEDRILPAATKLQVVQLMLGPAQVRSRSSTSTSRKAGW